MPSSKLETIGLRKEYPGTTALKDVSICFEGGQVHALLGKNGAGKSTLVKILAGAVRPTLGSLRLNGQKLTINSPRDACKQGIATVYQELSLVPALSIAENIFLGRLPQKRVLGKKIINWKKVHTEAKRILADLGVSLDTTTKVYQLGVAQQQVVEIAKAMSYHPAVLMLDEPTSALAYHEAEMLFKLIRRLAESGVAVLYISHRLQELHHIADQVSVLRDGTYIGTIPMEQATPEKIVEMMFGETTILQRPDDLKCDKIPMMKVHNLSRREKLFDVNFELYRGEVLGIAGMLGSGRT